MILFVKNKAFFISVPHSGEKVPSEVDWLHRLPEPILMCDVDRYVDLLYQPAIEGLNLDSVVTKWHRYVVDLNRLPEDIDVDSVEGSKNPSGTYPSGLHWSRTTTGHPLIRKPMSFELHQNLIQAYYHPFHEAVRARYQKFKQQGATKVYQLDAHSMPSVGTEAHKDPGQERPELVVSDFHGTSCETGFKELVIQAYQQAGFEVAYNWPYVGGRVTQIYGKPQEGQHCIQVELKRALYMDEESKKLNEKRAATVQERLKVALSLIYDRLP